MVLPERIEARHQQAKNAIDTVCKYWPSTGRQTSSQKYFLAWQTISVTSPSGQVRTKRVYSGPCFSPIGFPRLQRIKKLFSLILSLLCCVLLYLAVDSFGKVGDRWYLYIPQVICCLGSMFLVYYSGVQALSKPKLMANELWVITMRFLPSALFMSVVFAVTDLIMLFHVLFFEFSLKTVLGVVYMFAAFFSAATMFYMEYRTDYVQVFNENAPPELNPKDD